MSRINFNHLNTLLQNAANEQEVGQEDYLEAKKALREYLAELGYDRLTAIHLWDEWLPDWTLDRLQRWFGETPSTPALET